MKLRTPEEVAKENGFGVVERYIDLIRARDAEIAKACEAEIAKLHDGKEDDLSESEAMGYSIAMNQVIDALRGGK